MPNIMLLQQQEQPLSLEPLLIQMLTGREEHLLKLIQVHLPLQVAAADQPAKP